MIIRNLKKELADAQSNIRSLKLFGYGGTFLDCGANIFEVSLKAADQFDKVIGIEAHPATFSRGLERVKKSGKNILCLNAVVHDKAGVNMFVSSPTNSTGASAREKKRLQQNSYYEEVVSVSFDDLMAIYQPRVVKMDIEGGEYFCLPSALFPDCVEFFSVEYHGARSVKGWEKIKEAEIGLSKQGFKRIKPDKISMTKDDCPKALFFIAIYKRSER